MAKYSKGSIVINVVTKEKGVIVDILPMRRGKQYYDVLINGSNATLLESNLMEDVNLSDPFEKLKRGIFSTYDSFLQDTTSFKIKNSSNSNISTLKSSKTLFRAYQFKPLLKILNSPNRRLLVADEVGLGKTIEAGHIMLELQARGELRNVVIVCPTSLKIKWRDELHDKFGLKFKIYDTMRDVIEDFRTYSSVKAILNYEKIRKPREIEEELKGQVDNNTNNTSSKGKKNKKQKVTIEDPNQARTLAEYLQLTGKRIDLMICDEAHRARNNETQTYKGIKHLMDSTKAALFLTATPIMISQENLFNLLRLLNEPEYPSYSIFLNNLRVNEPFIKALSRLNHGDSLRAIAKDLENTNVTTLTEIAGYHYEETETIGERFKDIPLYHMIIDTMRKGIDNHNVRVQLQFDISSLSKLNNIFSRTRKREVIQDTSQAERNPITKIVMLHPDEQIEFDRVIKEYEEDNSSYIDEFGCDLRRGAALGLIQRKRQISSSIYAYLNSIESLQRGFDAYAHYPDAKFEMLLTIIREVVDKNHKKIIVFALFHKTLEYLRLRLNKVGYGNIIIHGGIDERENKIAQFRDDPNLNILLSSEVGSEGLDMQFCEALVNYDLPWNPMVVEQRIGRIDRFGQQSPKVNIYTILIEGSIQEIIYDRLLNRIGIFRDSIGDLEAILDAELESNPEREGDTSTRIRNHREYFTSLEKELYTTKLTKEEQERKTEDVAKAIIREKKHAEEISAKLNNSLTNDISFQNEIEKILHRNQYVTDRELIAYVKQLIRKALPTCRLEAVNEGQSIFKFIIPKARPKTLINFLTDNQPSNTDLDEAMAQFRNKLRDETEIVMTFSQDTAYRYKNVMFINAYNPIILSALEYFKRNTEQTQDTFRYALEDNSLPEGEYGMALYEFKIKQFKYGVESETKTLYPILYDFKNGTTIDDVELTKDIWGKTQSEAKLLTVSPELNNEDMVQMKIELSETVEQRYNHIFNDQNQRMESVKLLDIQRMEEYYKNQIEHQTKIVDHFQYLASDWADMEEGKNAMRVLPAQRGLLQNLKDERKRKKELIKSMHMEMVTPTLISLSYIVFSPKVSK